MNTYKLIIETNLDFFSLKEYGCKYVDFKASSADEAIEIAKAKYGKQYKVELVSII